MYTALTFLVSLGITFVILQVVSPRLHQQELIGRDVNKPDQPAIPEMGGIAIVLGLTAGILLVISLNTFVGVFKHVEIFSILMALLTTSLIAHIGIVDDLIGVRKSVKAVIPAIASFPLVVINVEQNSVGLPFLNASLDFGILYPLLLVPIGITVGANAVNMLAGFNGLESGMGIAALGSLGVIAFALGKDTILVLIAASLGTLIATIYFNWYPARVLIGDVGTLSIGAIIAATVIIGNIELAGVILLVPYFLDFVIKAWNGFPTENWSGDYRDGKLHCPEAGPVGLAQVVMKISDGISEWGLTLALMVIELLFGLLAVLFYVVF